MRPRDNRTKKNRDNGIDAQFDLRKRHPFARYYLLWNAMQSQLARLRHTCALDRSYGDTAGQKIDIFPAPVEGAPVFVFIHGGYFRALDKGQYRYIAHQLTHAGYSLIDCH